MCSACGKAFKQAAAFKQHLKTHEARVPQRCAACGRAVSRAAYLQLHMRTRSRSGPTPACFATGRVRDAVKSTSRMRRGLVDPGQ